MRNDMKKTVNLMVFVSGFMVLNAQAQAVETKPAAVVSARPTKIATIDPQSVIAKSDQWKDEVEKAQVDFEKRIAELQKQKEEFNLKAKNPASSVERELAKDLAKKQKDIEIEERSLQGELQQKEQEMQQKIAQKVDAAIEVVAKAQGWDAVFPKFFYASKDIDITNAVAEQMNKDFKKEKAAAKLKKEAVKAPVAPAAV
jgi:Skp family chaperone for outer membrane proteins